MIAKIKKLYRLSADRGISVMLSSIWRLAIASLQRMFGQRYLTRRIHSYRMTIDADDAGISRSLLLFGTREVDHKVMLEKIVRPGMCIFDIGGNIGYYPLMELALLKGSGALIAVEPSPSNVALLKRNLRLNGYDDVPVIEAAVSSKSGKRAFYLSEQSNLGTFHPNGSAANTLTGGSIEVETVTVPMLAKKYGKPDLMRMDVEGHEVEILNGMLDGAKTDNYAPIVIFETHLSRYGPHNDMARALRNLIDFGYAVSLVSSSSDHGTENIKKLGYKSGERIRTDDVYRTLFADLRADDAIDLICRTGGIRTVILSPPKR
jgi:FkbM family methyltransferase